VIPAIKQHSQNGLSGIGNMKKFLYVLPLLAVATLGIYDNTKYYEISFIQSGYNSMSRILAITFISAECILWLYNFKQWFWKILKVSILLYSISVTLSGQFFDSSLIESESNKNAVITQDYTEEINDYREQITALNARIDTYIEQQRLFGSERNRADRENAEKDLKEVQDKLDKARNIKRETETVERPKTSYIYYAELLNKLLKKDFHKDDIRVLFQLFSSVILALLAPMSLSKIRTYKSKPVQKKSKHKKLKMPKLKLPKISMPKLKLPAVKKTPEPEPEPMKRTSASNIVKMLLTGNNCLLSPQIAYEEFMVHPDREKKKLIYSIEDCTDMYDFIVLNKLENKNKDEIMEVWDGKIT
jgi:hypothetical protein